MSALSVSVSSTTASVNTSLEAEVAELTNVGTGISDLSTALDTVQPTPSLNPITSSSFNATTWSAIVEAAQAVQSASINTSSFVASVQTALSGSVSYFSSEEGSLTTNGTRLRTQLAATAGVVADAAAALNTELATRQSEISSARNYMAQALSLFTDLDISGGASAMLQATVELKAASAISASV
ncbi:MAG: hypothetical protein HY297_01025 [Thaumarchaeota archaeon]|nr:hypothetical protein [Nitrososphaerota archaeon]